MASMTAAAAVTIPSFTGLRAGASAAKICSGSPAGARVVPTPMAIKASLRDTVGIAAVATAASAMLAGNAFAFEVLLGASDGGLVFVPNEFTVPAGEKIVFKNNAGFPHNVIFDEDEVPSGVNVSAISMNEEDLLNAKDESFSITLNEKGTYSFYCAPHQGAGMVGKVTVQ